MARTTRLARPAQRLLAHELTHVVQGQQGRTRTDGERAVSQPGDSLEHEAEQRAASLAARRRARAGPGRGVGRDAGCAGTEARRAQSRARRARAR